MTKLGAGVVTKLGAGVVTKLGAGRSRVGVLVEASDFSALHNAQTGSGAHPASYSVGTGVLSRG